jgi:hypothetical protein
MSSTGKTYLINVAWCSTYLPQQHYLSFIKVKMVKTLRLMELQTFLWTCHDCPLSWKNLYKNFRSPRIRSLDHFPTTIFGLNDGLSPWLATLPVPKRHWERRSTSWEHCRRFLLSNYFQNFSGSSRAGPERSLFSELAQSKRQIELRGQSWK